MPELERWALIGYILAATQPEFSSKRRGQPKVPKSKGERQLELVEFGQAMFPGVSNKGEILRALKALPNKDPTVAKLIDFAELDSLPKLACQRLADFTKRNRLHFILMGPAIGPWFSCSMRHGGSHGDRT